MTRRFTRAVVRAIELRLPRCRHIYPAGDVCDGLELHHVHQARDAVGHHGFEA